ncbi:MAG TPA: metalloregulator ArsR/SmtB family transcription factor [Candidatus Limnocylindrales bacterium]|jgi:ArsR family transcriptional regulator
MDPIYELQASVLRTLAHARRLEILHLLTDGPMEVGRIAHRLGISQPNASQHLALLRTSGLVEIERNGREIRYQLADPQVMVACSIMRGFLERRISHLSRVTVAAAPTAAKGVDA